MDIDKLKQSFERQRKEPLGDFDRPLREAEFIYEICNSFCAKFDREYLVRLKNILGGGVKIYMESTLKEQFSTHNQGEDIFMNEKEIDYILAEIEYYVENDRWRECRNE